MSDLPFAWLMIFQKPSPTEWQTNAELGLTSWKLAATLRSQPTRYRGVFAEPTQLVSG